jgi:RES domain-containing protein
MGPSGRCWGDTQLAKKETEPGVQELFVAIASCLPDAVALHQVVYRSVAIRHASAADFLSGAGAAAYGGRWNPPGIEAVYASLSISTAVNEAYQNILHYGFSASTIRPRVLAGAELLLQSVLDLTDQKIRRRLGFTLMELLDEDWLGIQEEGDESWTQAIGRGTYMAGFEGLLAPSVQDRHKGVNVVIFTGRLHRGSKIVILGEDELPPHPTRRK